MPNFANPQDLNRLSYVRNNPVNATDPSGHKVCLECVGGGGGVGSGAVLYATGIVAVRATEQAAILADKALLAAAQYGPQAVQWGDKVYAYSNWLLSGSGNSQGATNTSQAGNSASSGDPGGFDPNDPWRAFRNLGLQNKDVSALQDATARNNPQFSLEKAYQDAQFLQQQGIRTTGHVLEQSQIRGVSSQQISGIVRRSTGYGTSIYESGTTGRYIIWSSTQRVAVVVENISQEVVTVIPRTRPSGTWTRVNPFEIPQWLQLP